MTAQLASRVKKARHESVCPICRQPIKVGHLIAKTGAWVHAGCVVANLYKNRAEEKTS